MTASSPRPAGSDVCRCGHRRDQHRDFPGLGTACAVTGLREDEWADACWRFEPQPEDVTIDLPPNPTQRRIPIPAAPDTTGGELRDDDWWTQLYLAASRAVDEVPYAAAPEYPAPHAAAFRSAVEPALRDLLAERDTFAAQVQAGLALAEELDAESEMYGENADGLEDVNRASAIGRAIVLNGAAYRIRRALGTPTTGGGE